MAFSSYAVDNDRSFAAALKRASEVTQDLRIPFGLILADFYKSEQAIFGLSSEGQYPPISAKYGKWKEQHVGFKYPLLVKTGKLGASLLSDSAPGSVASIGPTQLQFGTAIQYGIYHQSDEPRKKIPLRKFLFIGPEASRFATSDQMGRLERWNNIMNDFVLKKMKASMPSA